MPLDMGPSTLIGTAVLLLCGAGLGLRCDVRMADVLGHPGARVWAPRHFLGTGKTGDADIPSGPASCGKQECLLVG